MGQPQLTRILARLILVAAVLTAPVFLYAEGFEAENLSRVAMSNGLCALLCLGILRLIKWGYAELAAYLLVLGLLSLVGTLAWINGEAVNVNVVNFILVAVVASAVADRGLLLLTVLVSAAEMVAIAWTRTGVVLGKDLAEERFEAIAQFLPTYLVIVVILFLRQRV